MYLDLDLHYGDGVAQAFLSPTHYLPTYVQPKKPPRPPQVLTLSVHHSSPIFFPPTTQFSGLPQPDTPHPFTLSLPLSPYPGPSTYARLMRNCVEPIFQAFNPDYVVLQLGVDGLPGDEIGRFGGWSTEGDGGVRWCVDEVKGWGRKLCVLGGGGYRHADAARAWALATADLVSVVTDAFRKS
jgi:histone deacetylase 1/2